MKRRRELSRKERMIVYGVVAIIIGLVIVLIALTMIHPVKQVIYALPPYSGEYSDLLRDSVSSALKTNGSIVNETIRYLFLEEYKYMYNGSLLFNNTFTVAKGLSVKYTFLATRNETIIVDTHGNGSYYYALFYSENEYLLEGSETLGNTTRIFRFDIPDAYFPPNRPYMEVSIIISTNSTGNTTGYVAVSKRPPDRIDTIIRRAPIAYFTLAINSWLKYNYTIYDEPVAREAADARSVGELLSMKPGRITSLEAALISKTLLDRVMIESHIVAIDVNGDDVIDHFAVLFRYPVTPAGANEYSSRLLNILEGFNLIGELGSGGVHVKFIQYNGYSWIILDPMYSPGHIPGQVSVDTYNILGMIV